jgi:hypothetical protein
MRPIPSAPILPSSHARTSPPKTTAEPMAQVASLAGFLGPEEAARRATAADGTETRATEAAREAIRVAERNDIVLFARIRESVDI